MPELPAEKRVELRALAHGLKPVVTIGDGGLSDSVLREIDSNLSAHELIKIRVFADAREVREGFLETICASLGASPVQHIGKLLVVWRARDDTRKRGGAPRRPDAKARRTKRSMQGSDPRS